jgi:hypothetical protein
MSALLAPECDPDAVLAAAVPIYWMFGRSDVTLAVLSLETGVDEAALAATFGDAQGAFLAALAAYAAGPGAAPYRAFATAGMRGFEPAVLDLIYDDDIGRGCLLTLAVTDFAPRDPAVAAAVAAHVAALIALAGPARDGIAPAGLPVALAAAAVQARSGRPRDRAAAALAALLPDTAAAEPVAEGGAFAEREPDSGARPVADGGPVADAMAGDRSVAGPTPAVPRPRRVPSRKPPAGP